MIINPSSVIKTNQITQLQKKLRGKVKTSLSGKQKKLSEANKKLSPKRSKKTLSEQNDKDLEIGSKKSSSLKLLVTENASDRKIISREKSVEFSREHIVESMSLSEDQSPREETFDSERGWHQEDVHEYREIGTQSSSIDFTRGDHLDEKYKYENVKNDSIEKIEKTFELDKETSSIESLAQGEVVKSIAKQETFSGTDVVSIDTNVSVIQDTKHHIYIYIFNYIKYEILCILYVTPK